MHCMCVLCPCTWEVYRTGTQFGFFSHFLPILGKDWYYLTSCYMQEKYNEKASYQNYFHQFNTFRWLPFLLSNFIFEFGLISWELMIMFHSRQCSIKNLKQLLLKNGGSNCLYTELLICRQWVHYLLSDFFW